MSHNSWFKKCLIALGASLGLAGSGVSSAYPCTGTLDWVALNPSGTVTVSSQSSGLAVFYVCQMDGTMNGVSTDTCNSMLATLLTAVATGAQVTWNFNDSLTCNRASFNSGSMCSNETNSPNWAYLNSTDSNYSTYAAASVATARSCSSCRTMTRVRVTSVVC